MAEIARARYSVEIVTTAFHVTGDVEPIGPWQIFLNSPDRCALTVCHAHVAPLTQSVHLSSRERPQVYLSLNQICFIILPDVVARESITLMKHVETAICHVGPIVCRSNVHMGAEARLQTFLDDLSGHFFPVTHAELYPLTMLDAPLTRKAELMLINRRQVQLYYAA